MKTVTLNITLDLEKYSLLISSLTSSIANCEEQRHAIEMDADKTNAPLYGENTPEQD
ncbi:hypothetical protein MF628_001971 [Paenibacillus polymyxa]|uniref:hypothetical protein n=1 Tax=Paenibacillus polymyxa TaxID=1406 RepID=UPI0020240B0C|nr:hypothetical protein [Paenibacillus polymyxa]URJ47343.1 hypothetical protein MF628_001971 [Paenibacillus polymyxa]